jgi:hypothetical protein
MKVIHSETFRGKTVNRLIAWPNRSLVRFRISSDGMGWLSRRKDGNMQRTARPNIAFAGLTAAGRTTHARLLAEQLGYEVVSATTIILDILGVRANPEQIWTPSRVLSLSHFSCFPKYLFAFLWYNADQIVEERKRIYKRVLWS